MFGRLFRFGYLGLKTPQILVQKEKTAFVNGSTVTCRIRQQKFRIYLPKTARIFDLFGGQHVKFAYLALIRTR